MGHNNPVVAVTGANGKTTTTAMIDHLLGTKGGTPIVWATSARVGPRLAERVAITGQAQATVLEVSSFQLDGTSTFRPNIGLLLGITDHLDRYGYEMANYAASKWRITVSQTAADHLIYNADCPWTQRMLDQHGTSAQLLPISADRSLDEVMHKGHGGGLDSQDHSQFILQHSIHFHDHSETGRAGETQPLQLHGCRHDRPRARFAQRRHSRKLAKLRRRRTPTEFVQEVNGITFINDSKATNVNSVWYALECATAPVIWVAGGIDKGNDYNTLVPLVRDKVKHLICMGKNGETAYCVRRACREQLGRGVRLKKLWPKLMNWARPADTAMLSTRLCELRLFGNYEQRGRAFKAAVRHSDLRQQR